MNGVINYKKSVWVALNGQIQVGRKPNKNGAHARGWNSKSIGICLIHDKGDKFTFPQKRALNNLLEELVNKYDIPVKNILGHCEIDKKKPDCPGINMEVFRENFKEFIKRRL